MKEKNRDVAACEGDDWKGGFKILLLLKMNKKCVVISVPSVN